MDICLAFALVLVVLFTMAGCVNRSADETPTEQNVVLLYSARLVHDGTTQTIVLETVDDCSYVLTVKNENNKILWQSEAGSSHAGWNTLLLTHIGNKEYLTQYNPAMYQGLCTYKFAVFSLDKNGREIVLEDDEVDFSINPPGDNSAHFRRQDIEPIKAFFEHLNQYLPKSELLLNTDMSVDSLLPEDYRGRVYGTHDNPIKGLSAVFYGSADLSINDQMNLFIDEYIRDCGAIQE